MKVLYPMYYALTLNAYNGLLKPGDYIIDFVEYVKAGLAYNTRGRDGIHKIQVYGDLLQILEGTCEKSEHEIDVMLLNGIRLFYDDLNYLYSRLATALYKRSRETDVKTAAGDVRLIADFSGATYMHGRYPSVQVKLSNSHNSELALETLARDAPAVLLLSNTQAGGLISVYTEAIQSPTIQLLEVLYD